MRTTMFDLSPLTRIGIGFDRIFDLLDEVARDQAGDSYPPYDIEKTGENAYRITLAVAGFAPEELAITSHPNSLVIVGKKSGSPEGQYLHQGIGARKFERQFTLADYVKVTGAALEQGLLTIDLVHQVPEAMRPKRIEIVAGNKPRAIEGKQAA